MAPRAENGEGEEEEEEEERDMFNSEEEDDVLDEDMEALRRACMITGTNPDRLLHANASSPSPSPSPAPDAAGESISSAAAAAAEDDDVDDLELVRNIRNRFSTSSELFEPLSLRPLCVLPPAMSDDDGEDDDDFETLRAIQKRFAAYNNDALINSTENFLEKEEKVHDAHLSLEKGSYSDLIIDRIDVCKGFSSSENACQTTSQLGHHEEMQPSASIEWHHRDPSDPSTSQPNYSSFPKSAKVFMDAIKKNRSFQKILRAKLIQIEAKMEENKKLKERVKILRDFQANCKRRTGRALSQKKDSRVQLISRKKLWPSKDSKVHDKKIPAMYYGPVENSHVANYRMALTKFPLSLDRKNWSENERKNLGKGIQQQFQETMLQIMVDRLSGSGEYHDVSNDLDNILVSIKDFDVTPESIRGFLPKVNWERLASMYVVGRSGAECESRWLNFEDSLINRNPWTAQEDKNLLLFVQEKGISNWIDIAASLRTNRTPFQCLVRYQRSLNVSILKREWTKNEDAKLRSAVEAFGESDWQSVASVLEGWTGTQCSNRWKKSLHPTREKVGRWTADEDKRLKVAQLLFGPRNWKKTAQFVPGRTEVQCRERWVNSLDPSLSWDKWTEEEDLKLKAAIAEHGYCWAKVASALPRRTDNMCRRRWKRLLPDEVPLLQAAKRIQKAAFIANFVDRESERPALCPSDFGPLPMITSSEGINHSKKQTGKPRKAKERNLKKSRENIKGPKDVLGITNCGEIETIDGHEAITRQASQKSNLSKQGPDNKSKKRSHKPPSKRKELTEHNGATECLLSQTERLNLTSDGDRTEPLGEINTTSTKTRRAPSKRQCTKMRSACSRQQYSRNSTTNSGEHQLSNLSSEKSLVTGIATDVTLQHDGLSCLDSTEIMVINGEEIGMHGGNDKMTSAKSTGPTQYRRRNKGYEPAGGLQEVVPVPSQHNRRKKLKCGGIFCSDQKVVTADDDIPLSCFVNNKSKKRKLKVNDCGRSPACPPLMIQQESEMFPERVDTSHAEISMPSSIQDAELTHCNGRAFDQSSSCNVKSGLLMGNSSVVASDNEPGRINQVGGRKVACQEPANEMASIDSESGRDDDDISLASLVQEKLNMERQTSKSGTQASPPSSLIRGSQLLSKREVSLDEPRREQVEEDNEVGDVTLASIVRNRSRKKRRLQSAE
ncbi:Octamer-binding transcription factor [Trema orientale]|uniref:Octamer-binding transcription factor n=1 Tax=Trema orientale TaxID=63057 RepID=A0A2P5AHC9_TREOI|nr:Octamer-binding transcription factor [Trema orientale]